MHLNKSFTVIFLFLLIISSCNSSTKNNGKMEDEAMDDTDGNHTALNSLDWEGEYIGVVPCADCEGIETTLILKKPGNYSLSLKYLGKSDSIYNSEGTFNWHKDGLRITLNNIEKNANSYMVGENQVFLLDKEGAKIKGNLEEYYVLLKD